MSRLKFFIPIFLSLLFIQASCKKSNGGGNVEPPPPEPVYGYADVWTTYGDKTSLLQKQAPIAFGKTANTYQNIEVDSSTGFQTVDGFGFTLTGGSAYVISQLPASQRNTLLRELFSGDENSIKVSYLRISIGASDLNASVFSYDDLAPGETDLNLGKFSLGPDRNDLLPLLKEIIAIRPSIKIIATPWSPPVWMKDNGSTIGGKLKSEYYDVYARYFVKYIQQMQAEGITISAITPQNEPLNPGNNPSMLMSAGEQALFIKNNLGPAFRTAGLTTKIIIYDHNCDKPEYHISVLSDAEASEYIDRSAIHF
jgi:glucosylceramidase